MERDGDASTGAAVHPAGRRVPLLAVLLLREEGGGGAGHACVGDGAAARPPATHDVDDEREDDDDVDEQAEGEDAAHGLQGGHEGKNEKPEEEVVHGPHRHTLRRGDKQQQVAGDALHAMMETARAVSAASRSDAAGWGFAFAAAWMSTCSVGLMSSAVVK